MLRSIIGPVTILGLGLGLAASLASPVHADVGIFADPVGDAWHVADIQKVRVQYAKRVNIQATYTRQLTTRSLVSYWIDTRPANRGPEFYASATPNTESFGLFRVDRWNQLLGDPVRCPGLTTYADISNDSHEVRLSVPARCIGAPDRVRIAVRIRNVYQGRTYGDWYKAPQTFSPFVDRF